MAPSAIRWLLLFGVPLATACNLLTPLVFFADTRKKVAGVRQTAWQRVAILVWTESATLFDYKYARMELATYVGDKLQVELTQRNSATQLIDPRDVEDFLQRHPATLVDPHAVGRNFNADYVVFLEIAAFQMRDPRLPQLMQGRITAAISVHDVRADSAGTRRFDLTPVHTVHPEDQPIPMSAGNVQLFRETVYRKFAEETARKFYEHTLEQS